MSVPLPSPIGFWYRRSGILLSDDASAPHDGVLVQHRLGCLQSFDRALIALFSRSLGRSDGKFTGRSAAHARYRALGTELPLAPALTSGTSMPRAVAKSI
jgi:hypothetical protein